MTTSPLAGPNNPSATPDVVAVTSDLTTAGAVLYWRLSGTTNGDKLAAVWSAAGLEPDLLPDMPSVELSLRRAMSDQRQKRMLVRPLDGAKGWMLVRETAVGESLTHKPELCVRMQSGVLTFEPADHELRAKIVASYDRHLTTLSAEDISKWLCSLIRTLHAVTLRESGGIYFILHDQVTRWHTMVRAIRTAANHTLFEIPAMRSEDAVEAVIAAVQAEAEQVASTLETELDIAELSPGALRTRQSKVQATAAKVSKYERFLGVSLAELQLRLRGLNANLAEAALLAAKDG